MIHAKDWISFLEQDVPVSDLPIPPEHLFFVKAWLQEHNRGAEADLLRDPPVEFEHLRFLRGKSCVYLPVTAYVDAQTLKKIEKARGKISRARFLGNLIAEELNQKS